jgi:hypothetical protein
MVSKRTLDSELQFSGFDPKDVDVSEIKELTDSIPSDGNVDVHIAERMATKFLRGADQCAEKLSILTWWAAKMEDNKRHTYASKFFEATSHGCKSGVERKAYAEGTVGYLSACESSNRAKAMKQWLQNKHESLISAHYLMKHIAKGGKPHEQASGGVRDHSWEDSKERVCGEQEW